MLTWGPWGSLGFTRVCLGVIGIIRVRLRSLGRDYVSSVSFTLSRIHGRFHSGSRGFTRGRLGVVGFIRVRVGLFGFAWVNMGVLRGRWVDSGSRRFNRGSLGVIAFAWVHSGGRRVHSGSLGFTCALLNVTELLWVRVGSIGRT